jgi:hypothetical protein
VADSIPIIKHEAVPQCGSFEVRFPDYRPSQYFYWDDFRLVEARNNGPCDGAGEGRCRIQLSISRSKDRGDV